MNLGLNYKIRKVIPYLVILDLFSNRMALGEDGVMTIYSYANFICAGAYSLVFTLIFLITVNHFILVALRYNWWKRQFWPLVVT